MNRETDRAIHYHDRTKHSYWSIRTTPHYLDWDNKPAPFKVYPKLDGIPLPRELTPAGVSALKALSNGAATDTSHQVSLDSLASLLFYSAGVTKRRSLHGGTVYFRAAACAGALYPVEVYLVCGELNGLQAGVYHFNPGDFSTRKLREGDYRGALAQAAVDYEAIAAAPVTLVYTAISWRSSWKYRDRAYRYHYWDCGTIVANAITMARAHGLPSELVMGFIDSDVNRLIGVDGDGEFALGLLPLGQPDAPGNAEKPSAVGLLELETIPLSECEVEYPLIKEMHCASSLATAAEVIEWRTAPPGSNKTSPGDFEPLAVVPVDELGEPESPGEAIEKVIERRASTRRFARKPISLAELSTIVESSTGPVAADVLLKTNSVYLIANEVDGLEPGAYYINKDTRPLEMLKRGSFRNEAAYLTLGQDLGGDAAVTFFLMADLDRELEVFGNRGYRLAQMESGIIGGRMYLAAYALGRGATGLTFYDDDVTEFFSPHAAGKSCMLVVSVGVAGKRPIH